MDTTNPRSPVPAMSFATIPSLKARIIRSGAWILWPGRCRNACCGGTCVLTKSPAFRVYQSHTRAGAGQNRESIKNFDTSAPHARGISPKVLKFLTLSRISPTRARDQPTVRFNWRIPPVDQPHTRAGSAEGTGQIAQLNRSAPHARGSRVNESAAVPPVPTGEGAQPVG